jgi:plastocyanin
MNKPAKISIALAVIIIIVGTLWFVAANQPKPATGTPTQQTVSQAHATTPAAATITYDGVTFAPQLTTVKSGDVVKVTNQSQSDLDFDSDPHPIHTDDPDLNAGPIAPGQSKTFTVTKKGQFGFHNHLDSSQHGNITIE